MQSIIQKEKKCLVCETPLNIHTHHIFGGTANRRLSEKYGLTAYLCERHHNMADEGIHYDKDFRINLQRIGQEAFTKEYPNLNFREIFGKNFL